MKFDTKKITLSGVLIAMAAVLSMVKIIQMPLGGSVTLLSMLPICLLSIRYGWKWGTFCSFLYALIQLALDFGSLMSWGLTPQMFVGSVVFDYIIPYTALGLAGMFGKKNTGNIILGISGALVIRLLSHIVSGIIFFGIWAPEGWNVIVYAAAYNGAYMLPEIAFTVIAAVVMFKEPHTSRILIGNADV